MKKGAASRSWQKINKHSPQSRRIDAMLSRYWHMMLGSGTPMATAAPFARDSGIVRAHLSYALAIRPVVISSTPI
jgi:hypothetical protein